MVTYEFRPLTQWPGKPTVERKDSRFDSTYSQTLKLLDRELNQVSARNVVIQIALEPYDIRRDGLPRQDARKPKHPGIVLSFETRNGPLMFPCDTYKDWRDNLRAIALSLEALRAVDRYGVTKHGEQYKGWTALPPAASGVNGGVKTIEEAARFVESYSRTAEGVGSCWEDLLMKPDLFNLLYRKAAQKLHPDAGGDHTLFVQLQSAAELLKKHHHLG